MIKKRAPILILVLVLILLVRTLALTTRAEGDLDQQIYLPPVAGGASQVLPTHSPTPTEGDPPLEYHSYLPLVMRGEDESTPTPTVAVPTTTPTATPTPDPWIKFLTGYKDTRMKGLATGGTRRNSLTNYWGETVYPMGVFIVLFMDIQNCELESAYVSRIDTFWMRSGDGPFFDIASLEAQWAAEDEYDLIGVYADLQPTFTYQMVFVFDVPPQNLYQLWYRPWHPLEDAQTGSAMDVQPFIINKGDGL